MASPASPRDEKLYGLQIVRAVAAVGVVWTHLIAMCLGAGIGVIHARYGHIRLLGACGVDLFFVLSGFVVSMSAQRTRDAKRFIGRRFLRIYPLLWIAIVLYALLYLVLMPLPNPDLSTGGLLARLAWNTLLLPPPLPSHATGSPRIPASWTLVFEVFFYFTLYLGMLAKGRDPRKVSVAIVVSVILLNLLLLSLNLRLPFIAYYGNPLALEFAFGVGIGWFLERTKIAKPKAIALIVAGIAWFGVTAFHPLQLPRPSLLDAFLRIGDWGIPSVLIVTGFASLDWRPSSRLGRGAVYVGDACYSIYILQWIPMRVFHEPYLSLARAVGGDAAVLVGIVFVVGFGVLAYTFVEKPLTTALNARFFRSRRPEPPLADAGIAPPAL